MVRGQLSGLRGGQEAAAWDRLNHSASHQVQEVQPVERSKHMRRALTAAFVWMVLLCAPTWAADEAFRQWLAGLWPEAQQLGVSRATFEAATRGLEPDLT